MATIHDVAKEAGVSIKTVSRVVNQEANVRPKTSEKVQAAIKSLNYVPSHFARAMASGQSGAIAFLTDSVVTSPESIDIARGVAEAASEQGKALFFLASEQGKSPFEGPNFEFIRSAQVDGIIFATHTHGEIEVPDSLLEQSLVLVNCFEFAGRVPSVVPDDRQGGFLAGRLLIESGHTNAAFINLPEGAVASTLRRQGLELAFEKEGLPAPTTFYSLHEADAGYDADLTAKVQSILSSENRPSALFCGNDKTALKVFGIIQSMGLRVPEDLSLIGYDDFQVIAELLSPSLTTIALPYLEMGREAFSVLMNVIEKSAANQVVQPSKIQIPGWAVRRESLIKVHKIGNGSTV